MRVLVAEQTPRLASAIASGLQAEGIAADVAHDGQATAYKLCLSPYDVVVLDRDLRGISGHTICRMIVGGEDPPMVLMLASSASPTERVLGLALGAADYLSKPVHLPELLLRVRALTRRKPAMQHHKLQAAGIELDTLTGAVTRDGSPVELTSKEHAVLEVLLKASPGGLTAEQLLSQAWDENIDPFTNTVKVTIARLRRKLGQPPIIHSTPHIGYRLTACPAGEALTPASGASPVSDSARSRPDSRDPTDGPSSD